MNKKTHLFDFLRRNTFTIAQENNHQVFFNQAMNKSAETKDSLKSLTNSNFFPTLPTSKENGRPLGSG